MEQYELDELAEQYKMTTEFNLSEKMKDWVKPTYKEEKDVKEFIRLLKEEFENNESLDINETIDKLAGDKLC